jgi:Monooxygenase af470-like
MAALILSSMTAEVERDLVVFLIGMHINKPWKLHKWLPVFLAMPKMLGGAQGTSR